MGWNVSEAVNQYFEAHRVFSSPKQILAKGGELFVLLAGRPKDESYSSDLSKLETAMAEAGTQFSFAGPLVKNRRGKYKAITAGVTHGGGSMVSSIQPGRWKKLTMTLVGSWVTTSRIQ